MTARRHNGVLQPRFRELPAVFFGIAVATAFVALVHAMHPSESGTGGEVIRTEMLRQLLPAAESRSVKVMEIELAPSAEAPHHRDDVAYLVYVLDGEVESESEDGSVISRAQGGVWWQDAGPHVHLIARNASEIRRARLLVVFLEKHSDLSR
jgi:quercetin dioxygenase-like cupin family protein